METRILVISPEPLLGDLLVGALYEEGGYKDILSESNFLFARQPLDETVSTICIVDYENLGLEISEIVEELFMIQSELRFILIVPKKDLDNPEFDQFPDHVVLEKPIYLPKLFEIIDKVAAEEPITLVVPPLESQPERSQEDPTEKEFYPWLEDKNQAAQYLARLSLESAAQAALITQAGEIWAYAGELEQFLVEELADNASLQAERLRERDLAKFISLQNDQEYMLYATILVDDRVLSLLFDADLPFSTVRSQSGQVARALSAKPEEASTEIEQTEETPTAEPEETSFDTPKSELEALESEFMPGDWLATNITANDTSILEEIEETLSPFSIPTDWKPQKKTSKGPRAFLEELLGEPIPVAKLPYDLEGSRLGDNTSLRSDAFRKPFYPLAETLAETQPTRVVRDTHALDLEPVTSSYFDLSYACVLIPYSQHQKLDGELASSLEEWMDKLCISFDWELLKLNIQPDFMLWVVKVHSATAPGFLMQITTHITSQRIREHYQLPSENSPTDNFWSPGWLVVTSDKAPSRHIIRDFIKKARKQQAFDPPFDS